MTEHEFAMLAATLKSVYQRDGFMSDSEGVAIWYELLKDIPYDQLAAAVQKYIKCETFPPTIADLRRYVNIAAGNDWSVAWNKLQSGAKPKEVDYAGQYALMDKSVKQDLFRSGMLVWREEDKAARLEQKNHDCKRLSGSAE